ncbi:hypothetical protein BDQ17DRAFT_1349989 [Cyathus striatus]|nr:hypothetical protein BDQ17DRAFT_1349989 [Cyathus striatus]
MAFNGANNFTVNGTLQCVDNSRAGEDAVFNRLVEAACLKADHRCVENLDSPICHPETRVDVIREIESWIESSDTGQRVMWLSGSAGSGKSTIARTVAGRLDNQLASSFFFSRAEPGSGKDEGKRLIPTIACHLAIAISSFGEQLLLELKRNPGIWSFSLVQQLQKMVVEPLQRIASDPGGDKLAIPSVIIIDGLDECKDQEIQVEIIKAIVSAQTALSHCPSVNLRFLVLSRPEVKIRKAFSQAVTRKLVLDERYEPDKDIEAYLRSEFSTIKSTHSIGPHCLSKESEWPSDKDIKTLVERASGQFIYASTIVKYVMDDRKDPKKRLQNIINGPAAAEEGEIETIQYVQLDSALTSRNVWKTILTKIRNISGN